MRATRLFQNLALMLVASSLAGCPDRVAPLEIKVVKPSDCGTGPDPLEGVAFVRVRVLDDVDNTVVEQRVDVGSGQLQLEELPAAKSLRVQVAGLDADESMVSYGLSSFFTIPEELADNPAPISVKVFLRAVEKFSPVVSADDPTLRTALTLARAAHTATLLDDGRVLFTGGFQGTNRTNQAGWNYLASVEVFDPVTGMVTTEIPDMMFKSGGGTTPRAFHTAVKLPSGQVLISGGETATSGAMVTVNNSILYDSTVSDAPWAPIVTMKKPRSRHTATREQNGRVLLYGGIDWGTDHQPIMVDTFEWFDSEINRFRLPSDQGSFTRVGHAALPVANGQIIAIVGGADFPSDQAQPQLASSNEDPSLRFFKYDKDNDRIQPLSSGDLRIDPPRSYPAVASIGKSQFLVLGGFTGFDPAKPEDLFPTTPYAGSDVITLSNQSNRAAGQSVDVPRGHICAVTLQDGRVLAIGGRGGTNPARLESQSTNTIFAENDGTIGVSRGEPMAEPRYFHTCTLLGDGSVLVAGGVLEQGSSFSTLSSLEIFVPRPVGE